MENLQLIDYRGFVLVILPMDDHDGEMVKVLLDKQHVFTAWSVIGAKARIDRAFINDK